MGLHDRISGRNGNGAAAEVDHSSYAPPQREESSERNGPVDPYAELKTRIHHACIAKLGPELFKKETTEDLSERVLRAVTEQLALDRTDELLMLCGLDVPTLKNVRLSLQTLELLSFPPTRIRFVLNRANSKVGMSKKEVEGALDVAMTFEVPSDRAVPISVNRGNPAVLADGNSEFSGAVKKMAKALVASPSVAPKKAQRRLFALGKA